MKRQQLLNSFWPSLTAAVLATQPAWAGTVRVTSVRHKPTVKTSQRKTTSTISQQRPQGAVKPGRRTPPASNNGNSPDIRTRGTPAPRYLNPSPNPLQFPTKPEEVRIQGTQPITLQQAIDLARRNNRDLEVAELTLERSRAALREALAAEYPTLGVNVGVANRGSNVFSNNVAANTLTGTGTGSQLLNSTGTTTGGLSGTQSGGLTGVQSGGLTGTQSGGLTGVQSGGLTGTQTGSTGTSTVTPTVIQPGQATAPTTARQIADGTTTATPTGTTTTPLGTTTTPLGTTTTPLGTTTGTSAVNSYTSLNGTLSLSYNLFTSGGRRASIRAAEEQVRYYQLDVERQAELLRLNVSNDYYAVQGSDAQVRISQAAVTNAQASLRDAQALEQAGVGTRFDVLRSQVQLATQIQNLSNALSQQQISRRQLATRLSLAQSVDVSAADPVEIAGLWNLSLEDSIVLAFQNRAELQQFLAQRNISEQQRRLALSTLGPQVSLDARYGISDIFNDNRNFGDDYSVGATVSLNLYDGGAARSRARQREADIAIAETNFANQRNNVRFEVEQAYSNLQSNLGNIQTASVALEQAREALRLARLRFQAGVGTQTDVIAAENDLTNSEGSRVTAILNYNRALASLQRAITSGQPR